MAINKFKHLSTTPLNLSGQINNESSSARPQSNVVFTESITISANNTTGGGIIFSDDGDIVDLNNGTLSLRFSGGVQVYSGNRSGSAVISLESGGNINFVNNAGTTTRGVIGLCGDNDFWFYGGGATGSNAGFAQISTGDDGTEPIYVRQYIGDPRTGTLQRTATLLNESGNTSFPGSLTISMSSASTVSAILSRSGADPNFQLTAQVGPANNASGQEVFRLGNNYSGVGWNSYLQFIRGVGAVDGALAIFTNNTEALRIDSSQRVGIGTTIPTSKLSVVGDALITGITTVGVANTSTPPNNSQMSFELTSNTNLRIKVRGTDGVLRYADITLTLA